MTTLENIEAKHYYTFPALYKKLWEDEMLNWMRDFELPLEKGKTWAEDVYPTLKENPPVLLNSGGSDFELLTADEILNFEFPELWDTEKHHFIPFAKTAEGNIYAFYKNIEIEGENPIVLIWDDMDETEIIAKNFEDFIFRKMLEATDDIDKEDLDADYGEDGIEAYRTDLLADLKSITPYIKEEYVTVLNSIYNAEVMDMLFSHGFKSEKRLTEIIKEVLDFEYLDDVIAHEV
ncbi:MAG: SMI1/KNR4 family protein [Campylobacterota bacterium]|nr:SMI1/KNR4 family protein [Campylobacterota bacterium]